MKKMIIPALVLLTAGLAGLPQQISPDKVPAAVTQAFEVRFPAAADIRYHKEKLDYEVRFKDHGVARSANFDANGKWLETETEIKGTELPKEVSASVAANFAGYLVSDIVKVEAPGQDLVYEMDLKKDKEGYEVRFSPKGEVLKKTELMEEGDVDEDD